MKAIILAAGYATRLYPLTKNQPKPLLEVAGKSILDHTAEKLEPIDELDEIIVVTNDKFHTHFEEWKEQAIYSKNITIVNDGTLSNETRLGAIGDVHFVMNELSLDSDVMVIAGDNLFEFEFKDMADFYSDKQSDVIATYYEENMDQLKRNGIAELNDNQEVISFEEKPAEPKSNYCVPALYILEKETLPLISSYLDEGNNPDAPGHFIPYLLSKKTVHGYIFEGNRYDIGTLESYDRVQKIFEEK